MDARAETEASWELDRPRLVEAIGATSPGEAVLISAPPGYGATVAMRQTLAEGGDTARWWQCPTHSSPPGLWDEFHNDLRAADTDWVVVTGIGDAEVAATWLPGIVDVIPEGTRLALLAHTSLADTLLQRPRSVQIDRHDLAFTPDEATAFLLGTAPDADPDDVLESVALCHGWATALALTAAQMRRHRPRSASSWLASNGASLIAGAWLKGLDRHVAQFLRSTAMLEDLQPELCDAVLGRSDSADILLTLERDEGLVERIAEIGMPPPVWRRHPLLTNCLRTPSTTKDHAPLAHARAASWYRAHDVVEPAMHHYVSAGLHAEAGAYLREHETDLLSKGSAGQALDWYERLPSEAWGQLAQRELRLAWGRLLSGDSLGARQGLATLTNLLAQATPDENADQMDELEGERCFLAAYLAARAGDPAQLIDQAQRAWELFGNAGGSDSHVLAPTLVVRGQPVSARQVLDEIDPLRFPRGILREVSLAGVRAPCAS